MDPSKLDLNALIGNIKDTVLDALKDVATGAAEDLQTYGLKIAEDLVRGAATGNRAVVDECAAQALLVAEVQRIRINAAAWASADKLLKTIGGTLLSVVATGVKFL